VTKYKEYFDLMIAKNKTLFDEFKAVHDKYGLEPEKFQKEFNKIGEKVQILIHEWEDKLCGRSETNGYASYSGNLAQKFEDEIRKMFPEIDNIGIIVEEVPLFSIKKINL